jgi:hypothetical protein
MDLPADQELKSEGKNLPRLYNLTTRDEEKKLNNTDTWFSPFLRTMGKMETPNSLSISSADKKLWMGSNS